MAPERPIATCYLAEVYTPRHGVEEQRAEIERIDRAVETLVAEGVAIRHLRSIVVLREEVALHIFEAERETAVERVLRDVGLEPDRISIASDIDVPESRRRRLPSGNGRRRVTGGDPQ